MRKVTKILGMVLSTIILLSIFLPVSISLVLSLKSVQNYVVDKAAAFASEYIGAPVEIGRIDIDILSRVSVEDFLVRDHDQDTLLYAREARALFSGFNIARDGLRIASAEATDACFCLRELDESGELNIRPIVARLSNPNGQSKFQLFIDHIHGENLRFVYERNEHRNPEYGIDYYDMDIHDIDVCIKDFAVSKAKVWADIVSLSAREKSGFEIGSLSTYFYVDRGVIRFDNFDISTANSHIYLPRYLIEGGSWECYKHFVDDVRMTGSVEHSSLSTADLGYFAPGLRDWNLKIENVDASVDGVVRDMSGVVNNLDMGEATNLEATIRMQGLPEWQTTQYTAGIKHLTTTSEDILAIIDNVVKEPLPDKVNDIIRNASTADLRATFGGRLDSFRVVGNLATAVGRVSADATIKKAAEGRYAIDGVVNTSSLELGNLLDVKSLGSADTHIVAKATVGGGDLLADVDARIDGLGFGKYRYRDIKVDGSVEGSEYSVVVNSLDENLEFDLYGAMSLDEERPTYDFSADIRRADLHALGINRRDSVSVISAMLGARAEGKSIDEMDGGVSIADVVYRYADKELTTDRLTVELSGGDNSRSVVLASEFVDLQFQSRLGYRDIFEYLYNSLKTYVPLLYDDSERSQVVGGNSAADYSMLKVRAGESINDLLDAISGGMMMAPETELSLMFSPSSNLISIQAESEALEYGGVIMANAEIDINNRSDSLSMWINSSGIYMGSRLVMPNFSATGGARENRISLTAGFRDDRDNQSGMLGLSAKFSRNQQTKRRSIHIDIRPSHFTTDTQQWKLSAKGIDIDSSRIQINSFQIARPEQQLIIDGVASRSRNDSIRLTLKNFDLAPLSAFTERVGYNFSSRANGYASMKSALRNPEIEANIDLDDIAVNDITAPPQRITSNWDFEDNRARVFIADRTTADTVIRGYYQPSDNRYYARAKMGRVKLALLQPFLKGIISDIQGDADVDVNILGRGRQAKLNGGATVDSMAVKVDYLNTRYFAPGGRVEVKDNHFIARDVKVYDSEGNDGSFSMDISLEHLSNVTFNIDIEAHDMLVLDTDSKDNDLFYGHVYASGGASFRGDKRGLKMDVEGTSSDNSHFYMPLTGKGDASFADFVKFTEPKTEERDTSAYLTRRMMAYERKNRPVNTMGSVMDIDLALNILPNIDIQLVIDPTVGDVIKAKGSGQLAMHIVPKANIFEMRGDYTISEGTYLFTLQNILNKKFDVVPGSSIHWTGDPLGAMLNIDAIYSTKASLRPLLGNSLQGIDMSRAVPVDCYIKLTDELMSPTVTFDVQVPNVAPEIQTVIQSTLNDQQAIATQMLWLLAANSFSAEDTGAMGASLSATTGFELLSNQLSNWLSGDNYNIVLRYRPRTELSGDEVDFGFSKSWFNNRLIVEVEGGYLSDVSIQSAENASNFVAEGFITWLIDPEGTFKFKGFTQTIDRYGENQGMQESGVGLYYSESFNTFGEWARSIRQRVESNENRKARREKREERRKERAEKRASKDNSSDVESVDILGDEEPTIDEEDIILE